MSIKHLHGSCFCTQPQKLHQSGYPKPFCTQPQKLKQEWLPSTHFPCRGGLWWFIACADVISIQSNQLFTTLGSLEVLPEPVMWPLSLILPQLLLGSVMDKMQTKQCELHGRPKANSMHWHHTENMESAHTHGVGPHSSGGKARLVTFYMPPCASEHQVRCNIQQVEKEPATIQCPDLDLNSNRTSYHHVYLSFPKPFLIQTTCHKRTLRGIPVSFTIIFLPPCLFLSQAKDNSI